jgi:hypothetical protein
VKIGLRTIIDSRAVLGTLAGPAIVLALLLAACAADPAVGARDHGFYGSATGGWTKLSAP